MFQSSYKYSLRIDCLMWAVFMGRQHGACGCAAGCYSLSRSDLEAVILAAGGKVVGDAQVAADQLHHRESLYVLVAKSAPEEAAQLAVSLARITFLYRFSRGTPMNAEGRVY